ncbi:MAG: AAA family ATPase [Phycisphaerae bacterium]|nr:AAA family ATPase [Phycisphaerae bacterium]
MANGPDSIGKIAVRGFKSIADEQRIELRPLTLLAGANSSGKSSIMQPILLLKQTLEAPSDPGPLLLDGPNVRFTSAEQLLSQVPGKAGKSEFAVRIELSSGRCLEVVFKRAKGVGFEVNMMSYSDDSDMRRIVPKMSHDEIIKVLPDSARPLYDAIQKMRKEQLCWSVYRERCFLSFELDPKANLPFPSGFRPSPSARFIPHLQGLIHLPGLRGNPRRTYAKSAAGPLFPGTFENYVASTIAQWQSTNDTRLAELGLALGEMGLTWKVKAEPVDDTQVELRVGRLTHGRRGGAHDLVSIADVGLGVSQSLPVVVALIVARPGQVVYLEQPEIHLHPRAQRRLAHVLADAANRGVIVVAETHSALLLREVQTIVATGKLSTDKVKLHWFQRQENGRTVVTPADLDQNGAYGDWPEDFDEVELNAEKAYLDAVESKEAGK